MFQKHPNEVWLRYSYDTSETWSKMSILKGCKKLSPSLTVTLPEKYPDGHDVKPKKLEQRMLPFIPEESRQFYFDLFARGPPDSSDDSENSD